MYTHPLYHWPPKSSWSSRKPSEFAWRDFGAYVHFPYCRNICDFCGYETRLISKPASARFQELILSEIDDHATHDDFSKAQLTSVFFGGGTASLMQVGTVEQILARIEKLSASDLGSAEITIECEPGTITRNRLKQLALAGVNRISACVQSFEDSRLTAISRSHKVADNFKLIDDCLAAGFDNLHLDLMYGLPGQTLGEWESTLDIALSLPVQHLSVYKLYVYQRGIYDRHRVASPAATESEEVTSSLEEMFLIAAQKSADNGFKQYTLTEFARSDRESSYIHQTFSGGDILPLGPSAFGRCGNYLWDNSPYIASYGDHTERQAHSRAYRLSKLEAFKRDMLLGFWLLGVDIGSLSQRYNVRPSEDLLSLLIELERQGLIGFTGESILLSGSQRFHAGRAMEKLSDLDTPCWGTSHSDSAEQPQLDELPIELRVYGSIIRMARRDPLYYGQIKEHAGNQASMRKLLAVEDLDQHAISEIIAAVTGNLSRAPSQREQELRAKWLLVEREHEHLAGKNR